MALLSAMEHLKHSLKPLEAMQHEELKESMGWIWWTEKRRETVERIIRNIETILPDLKHETEKLDDEIQRMREGNPINEEVFQAKKALHEEEQELAAKLQLILHLLDDLRGYYKGSKAARKIIETWNPYIVGDFNSCAKETAWRLRSMIHAAERGEPIEPKPSTRWRTILQTAAVGGALTAATVGAMLNQGTQELRIPAAALNTATQSAPQVAQVHYLDLGLFRDRVSAEQSATHVNLMMHGRIEGDHLAQTYRDLKAQFPDVTATDIHTVTRIGQVGKEWQAKVAETDGHWTIRIGPFHGDGRHVQVFWLLLKHFAYRGSAAIVTERDGRRQTRIVAAHPMSSAAIHADVVDTASMHADERRSFELAKRMGPPTYTEKQAIKQRMLAELPGLLRKYAWLHPITRKTVQVDQRFMQSLCHNEGHWDPTVISHAGAIGVCQIMPGTARHIEEDFLKRKINLFDPIDNLEASIAYNAHLARKYGMDWRAAAYAYNWGEGRVDALRSRDPSMPERLVAREPREHWRRIRRTMIQLGWTEPPTLTSAPWTN